MSARWFGLSLVLVALVAGVGCKATDKFLGSNELEKYRKEGMKSGQGLNVDKALDKAKAAAEKAAGAAQAAASKLSGHGGQGPAQGGSVYQILWRRSRCGVDAACMRETAAALRERGPGVGQALIDLLRKETPYDVRVEAIRALGWLRLTAATRPLLNILQTEELTALKREVLWSLGQIRDPSAVSTLTAYYDQVADTRVREAILNALGNFDTKEAVAFLQRVYEKGRESLRQVAVAALGRSERPEAARALAKALRDPNPTVRIEAFNALVIMNTPEAHKVVDAIRAGKYGPAMAKRLVEQARR